MNLELQTREICNPQGAEVEVVVTTETKLSNSLCTLRSGSNTDLPTAREDNVLPLLFYVGSPTLANFQASFPCKLAAFQPSSTALRSSLMFLFRHMLLVVKRT